MEDVGVTHTVTSGTAPTANALFFSPFLTKGQQHSHTFNEVGAFPYFCSIHPSMTGIVTVQ